jgi:tyrosyl-tRNA synthetase
LETGLSFIEFNYQLLQAYDFWYQFKHYNCLIQMGGSDQWGNIVAGIDLIRRLEGKQAYGITFPLIMTADGKKMGKTEKGAVWLDPQRTSPYEYYQFWINTDDRDVKRFLALFTFVPVEEIQEKYGKLEGADLRGAKDELAFKATEIVHGKEEGEKARAASKRIFSKESITLNVTDPLDTAHIHIQVEDSIPTTLMKREEFMKGIAVFKLFEKAGLCTSGSDARRLIEQGGAYLNNKKVNEFDKLIKQEDFDANGAVLLRAGKKKYHRIKVLDKK